MISLKASCKNKKVEHEDREVDALILSEGEGESEGALILDQDRAFYIAKTTQDLKDVIDAIIDLATQVQSNSTAWGAPVVLTGLISSLNSLKGNLK